MADVPDADALLQMAEHRGLKLVKSRRRKPGTGDYGKFGLKDAAGSPLLGFGDDGLTADAQDIAAYLRSGSLGTWQQSAATTPDRPPPPVAEQADEPASPTHSAKSASSAKSKSPPAAKPEATEARHANARPAKAASPPPTAPPKPEPEPKPEPKPEPQLALRAARPSDAAAIVTLLGHLAGIGIDGAGARRNLADMRAAGGGLILAELADPVGCCGWAVVHTIHRGPVGRITAVVVDPGVRRQGIARRLIAAAEQALADAGCTMIEAMSDIAIDNAHNFFRALGYDQSSYRFTRELAG